MMMMSPSLCRPSSRSSLFFVSDSRGLVFLWPSSSPAARPAFQLRSYTWKLDALLKLNSLFPHRIFVDYGCFPTTYPPPRSVIGCIDGGGILPPAKGHLHKSILRSTRSAISSFFFPTIDHIVDCRLAISGKSPFKSEATYSYRIWHISHCSRVHIYFTFVVQEKGRRWCHAAGIKKGQNTSHVAWKCPQYWPIWRHCICIQRRVPKSIEKTK